MTEIIGWISSFILVITISRQIYKQWREGSGEGVSIWLFIGQISASAGFLLYSVLVWNPVFIFTNGLMVINGIIGYLLTRYQKKNEAA